MSFLGGFAGVSQDPNTFEVQATTGWAVCEAKARRRAASPAVASPRDVGPSPREEGQRRMFKWLSSGATLEEVNGQGKLADHRREMLALAAELPPDSPIATALEVLAAALLLDLPFLRTYPEALLPVLHWRCSAHDNPVLAGLARRWWAERRPDGVWVHALTPPPHAPGGPLLAELRMERPHELRSPMTSEGHVVLDEQGVIYHWLPEEGALVEGPDVARPTHRQELLHRLPVPEGGEDTGGSFSPDGTLYALAGYGEDFCFGFLHLHEAATGRLVHQWRGLWPFWKRPVFSPDGRHVLALSEGGLLLCDTVTGQQEHLPIRDAKGAAFSADGRRLVTTDKEGVRLWDLARLRAWEPQEPEYSRPMGFSPDGRRLVVGEWLRDGATGQRLRKLGFDRGKYLMGGPPRNWFTCGSARIVSLREGLHVQARVSDDSWETRYWNESFDPFSGRTSGRAPASPPHPQPEHPEPHPAPGTRGPATAAPRERPGGQHRHREGAARGVSSGVRRGDTDPARAVEDAARLGAVGERRARGGGIGRRGGEGDGGALALLLLVDPQVLRTLELGRRGVAHGDGVQVDSG